jgi:Rrf2 family transcriptional regulator, cysteine metabolism repressor
MRVSYKSDYALKAILDLALQHGSGSPVTLNSMAARIDAPVKFLEQILAELKANGVVESRRGRIGGFRLSRAPETITVGQILRLVEGPTEPISCIRPGYSGCKDVYTCVFRNVWQDVFKATSDVIDRVTFADLVAQSATMPAYCI